MLASALVTVLAEVSAYRLPHQVAAQAARFLPVATSAVAEEWMRQRPTDGLLEVVVEGRLFTPPDGKAYVLVEFIRFVGTRNPNLRNGNFPSHRRPEQ